MRPRSDTANGSWSAVARALRLRIRWQGGSLALLSEDPAAKARLAAYQLAAGGTLLLLTAPLAIPQADFAPGLILAGVTALIAAALVLWVFERIPDRAFAALPIVGAALITACVLSAGGAAGTAYATLYFWLVPASFSLLTVRAGVLTLILAVAGYGLALTRAEGFTGGEFLLSWVVVVVALSVAGLLSAALRDRWENRVLELRRRGGRQDVVAEVGHRALAGAELTQLADWAASAVAESLGADHAGVFQIAPGEDALLLRAGVGWNPEIGQRTEVPIDEPLLRGALEADGALIANGDDSEGDERRRLDPHRHGAPASGCRRLPPAGAGATGIAVAIRGNGPAIGVLAAYSCRGQQFQPSDAGFIESVAQVLADAERRREVELLSRREALLDPLTGRPNRVLFMDRLEEALLRARSHRTDLAVLIVDIDDFRLINEASGADAGDSLLRAFPARIRRSLEMPDTVARIGGDEFAVLCESPGGRAKASAVAESILRSLDEPFAVGEEKFEVSACVGVVHFDGGEESAEQLLALAASANQRARDRGPGCRELFDHGDQGKLRTRLGINHALRDAAQRGEFSIAIQPVYYLPGDLPHSSEVLLRWTSPELGQVPPDEFLAIAEESGAITEIDDWVLAQACRLAASWRIDNDARRYLPLTVNISPRQLAQPNFIGTVAEQLALAAVAPRDLGLEITEQALVPDYEQAAATLGELRAMGVKVVLDDFGTGYSSLTHLRELPIDAVKVHPSLIASAAVEARDGAIINAITSMASSFLIEVIGEGVETDDHVEALRTYGCLLGQGYHLARPAPPESFTGKAAELLD